MDQIFLIDKPVGLTSREVCNKLQKKFHTKKVGHVGTLDPFASGLLIVGVNKATKSLAFFDESIKEYIATLVLGIKTDTGDNTGKVIKEETVKSFSIKEINEVLDLFKGKLKQVPPMTSAIRVNGVRLYDLAHQGQEINRDVRDIEVFDNKLIGFDKKNGILTLFFSVSKGTYIRTLCEDIAEKLGTIGHLSALDRVGVLPFKKDESDSLEDILNDRGNPHSVNEILSRFMDVISFDETKIDDIKNGKIKYLDLDKDRVLVTDKSNNAIAVYSKNIDNRLEFVRGLF